jgi:hypothetical protein
LALFSSLSLSMRFRLMRKCHSSSFQDALRRGSSEKETNQNLCQLSFPKRVKATQRL